MGDPFVVLRSPQKHSITIEHSVHNIYRAKATLVIQGERRPSFTYVTHGAAIKQRILNRDD